MMQHEMTLWGAHRTIDCAKLFADDEFALLELLLAKAGNYIQNADVLFAVEPDFASLLEESEAISHDYGKATGSDCGVRAAEAAIANLHGFIEVIPLVLRLVVAEPLELERIEESIFGAVV